MPHARTAATLSLIAALGACEGAPASPADAAAIDGPTQDLSPRTDLVEADAPPDAPPAVPTDAPPDAPAPRGWLRALDASFLVTPAAVAVAPDGTTCVVGDFQGDLRCLGRSVASSGASDGFVACFEPDGALRFLVTTGAPGDDGLNAVAWDRDALVVAGHLPAATSLGGIPLANAGGADVLVARLDREGRFTQAVTLGGAGADQPSAIGVDARGIAHLAGASEQTLRHGALTLSAEGRGHTWVLALDRSLAAVRGRSFSASVEAHITAMRVAADGATTLGGTFSGSLQTGADPLGPTLAQDVFVLRASPEGRTLWARRYGGSADDRLHDLDVDTDGSISLAGSSGIGRVTFGSLSFDVQGASDGWIARLDAVGAPSWLRRVGGAANDRALSLFVDDTGGEAVGRFDRTLELGEQSWTSQGEADGWRARFDRDGALRGVARYGGVGPDVTTRVVAAPGGSVCIGTFAARAELAGETLRTVGIAGAFVHRATVTP